MTRRLFSDRGPAPDARRAWLAAVLGIACLSMTPLAACAQAPRGESLDVLAAQWHALRPRRGHFDGAAFDPEIDRWQGRKHVLMQQLAARSYDDRLSRDALLTLMGTPDAVWRAGLVEYAQALREAQWQGAPSGQMLVYDWRARRDRLVFALDEGRVVAVGWLFAHEQR